MDKFLIRKRNISTLERSPNESKMVDEVMNRDSAVVADKDQLCTELSRGHSDSGDSRKPPSTMEEAKTARLNAEHAYKPQRTYARKRKAQQPYAMIMSSPESMHSTQELSCDRILSSELDIHSRTKEVPPSSPKREEPQTEATDSRSPVGRGRRKRQSPSVQEKELSQEQNINSDIFPLFRKAHSLTSPSTSNIQSLLPSASVSRPRRALSSLKRKVTHAEGHPLGFRGAGDKSSAEQMFLDVGQKSFGASTKCKTCGMMYTVGEPSDEKEHRRFCKTISEGISFPGWAKERVLASFSDGSRIIEIRSEDPASHIAKLAEVRRVMSAALGSDPGESKDAGYLGSNTNRVKASSDCRPVPLPLSTGQHALLCITERRVSGCLISERITQGFPILSSSDKETATGERGNECAAEGSPNTASDTLRQDKGLHKDDRGGTTLGVETKTYSDNIEETPSTSGASLNGSCAAAEAKRQRDAALLSLSPTDAVCKRLIFNSTLLVESSGKICDKDKTEKELCKNAALEKRIGKSIVCSTLPLPAVLGVSEVWVDARYRRRRIASRLLDTARQKVIYGYQVNLSEIAFTHPTPEGRRFAEKYIAPNSLLIYNPKR